ncbi:hypothetical protein T552_01932 [Pneumocystis carinii B80]|uniref:Histone deacetylase complex subunit SAP30 Sin3 binding domain-containing protein n=1 Tax=Pneumocystis carinii (strain B80) TaxID=1408658 RepID=A0A0W4ZI59_PNEC8|nr:hypothetical protein T552_01932 [Pneumocystis carinii B80]KTW28070.1 hypothetical protein T552_01932 [Pneumocystis carinii B80]
MSSYQHLSFKSSTMPPRPKQNESEVVQEPLDRSGSRQKRSPTDRHENCIVRESGPIFNANTLPVTALRRYQNVYKLRTQIGSSSNDALVNAVQRHFNALPVKEYDMIVQFLYTVKNKDKTFRRYFHDEIV